MEGWGGVGALGEEKREEDKKTKKNTGSATKETVKTSSEKKGAAVERQRGRTGRVRKRG